MAESPAGLERSSGTLGSYFWAGQAAGIKCYGRMRRSGYMRMVLAQVRI